MDDNQKKLFDEIVARWHIDSYEGLTLQQACFDIGVLAGLVSSLDREIEMEIDAAREQSEKDSL